MSLSELLAGSLVAEMVLAHGQIEPQPVDRAFAELATATRDVQTTPPYGAVITSGEQKPEPPSVWRTYLTAKDRFDVALAGMGSLGMDVIETLKSSALPAGISVISSSWEAPHATRSLLAMARDPTLLSLNVDDVFLLLSGHDIARITHETFGEGLAEMRLLIHMSGESSAPRFHATQPPTRARQVQTSSSDRSDDDSPSDAPTRAWREAFLKNVPCLMAEDIAREVGHQAKNRSATASRWVSEGKIFAVRSGGKLRYPAFQFRHGQPLRVIARILKALGDDPTGWDHAFFFSSPNGYLDNAKPMDRVTHKAMEETLVQLAYRHSHPADVF